MSTELIIFSEGRVDDLLSTEFMLLSIKSSIVVSTCVYGGWMERAVDEPIIMFAIHCL